MRNPEVKLLYSEPGCAWVSARQEGPVCVLSPTRPHTASAALITYGHIHPVCGRRECEFPFCKCACCLHCMCFHEKCISEFDQRLFLNLLRSYDFILWPIHMRYYINALSAWNLFWISGTNQRWKRCMYLLVWYRNVSVNILIRTFALIIHVIFCNFPFSYFACQVFVSL